MSHSLTIPRTHFESACRDLLRGNEPIRFGLTVAEANDSSRAAYTRTPYESRDGDDRPHLLIVPLPPVDASPLPPGLSLETAAVLAIGIDASVRGQATAWIRRADGMFDPNVHIRIAGSSMISLPAPGEAAQSISGLAAEKWSRTAEALNGDTLETMANTTVGIVGAGRLGNALIHYLVSLPIDRLVLVDADRVERHNLGEGGHFSENDVGLSKVETVGTRLGLWKPELEVEAHERSITSSIAMDALETCDVIFSVPDNPGARLAAAAVAVTHHIPLIDIGTRVHRAEEHGETMGADIRLVPPGRCLLCVGGVSDLETGRKILASTNYEKRFAASRNWRDERRGSLYSLNLTAIGVAARLYEEFVRGELRGPAWWHVGFDRTGRPSSEALRLGEPNGTCLCPLAGLGRKGYARFGSLLRILTQQSLDLANAIP